MRKTDSRNDALSALRRALLSERDRVVRESSTALLALAGCRTAADDESAVLHEQYIATARNTLDRERLALIENALARFERGEYGTCQECGGEISSKRLSALPWASRCVRCQEQFEADHDAALCA